MQFISFIILCHIFPLKFNLKYLCVNIKLLYTKYKQKPTLCLTINNLYKYADFVEFYEEFTKSKVYNYIDSKLEDIITNNSKGLGIRLLNNDTVFYVATNKKYDFNDLKSFFSIKNEKTPLIFKDIKVYEDQIEVKFKDITNITNMIGGVDIVVNNTFTQNNFSFEKGKIYNLKGEMALAYVRHRKTDGAFKRDERQRQVLKQIVKKILLNPILGYKVYKSLDIRYNQIKAIPSMLVLLNHNFITQYTINGKGEKKNGVYYFIPDKKSLNSIKWKFKI